MSHSERSEMSILKVECKEEVVSAACTLKDKLSTLNSARRKGIETEAERLHTEYLMLKN